MQDRIPPQGYTILRLGGTKADVGGSGEGDRGSTARRSPCSTFPTRSRATSTVTICCFCVPTCTWYGAASEPPDNAAEIAAVATGH